MMLRVVLLWTKTQVVSMHVHLKTNDLMMDGLNTVFEAVMAEWLRRLTRNQMGFPRAGSNPAHSEGVLNLKNH